MKKLIVPTLVAVATVIAFYACKKDVKSNSSNVTEGEIATKPPQQPPASSCANYVVALTRTYASGQTTFTWCITNPNPGNGTGGTIQNLSHWSFIPGCPGNLGLEQNWSDIVSASYSPDGGTTWNTIIPTPILTPDPSQSCSNLNVFKFNYGTSGSTATCYRLVLQGNYAQDNNNVAVFKSGANTGCCVRTVPGIGCRQDEFCSFSQGYFFAKPGPTWPPLDGTGTVTIGGKVYTEAEGRAIWGCSNAGGIRDSKKGFTQVAALKLSGLASDPGLDPAVAADMAIIENWLASISKLVACSNLPNQTAAQKLTYGDAAAAGGRIGNWINANHCTSNSDPE
ncbi:MAG TPA: hypothetical protein VK492_11090 [Chitinophagaceae bacterium]|nr:hypothetical protein [Chitinophagaceae bacterium]